MKDFDAHSPMFRNRHFNEERRSKLFSDKPWIYGRLPKYLLGWVCCMAAVAGEVRRWQAPNIPAEEPTENTARSEWDDEKANWKLIGLTRNNLINLNFESLVKPLIQMRLHFFRKSNNCLKKVF